MSCAIFVEPLAEEEWRIAAAWYEDRETGVGLRFNEEVQSILLTAAADPERFPRATLKVRKAKIIGWPYSVYFTVSADRAEVRIIAIWHGFQNPAKLRARLK